MAEPVIWETPMGSVVLLYILDSFFYPKGKGTAVYMVHVGLAYIIALASPRVVTDIARETPSPVGASAPFQSSSNRIPPPAAYHPEALPFHAVQLHP